MVWKCISAYGKVPSNKKGIYSFTATYDPVQMTSGLVYFSKTMLNFKLDDFLVEDSV